MPNTTLGPVPGRGPSHSEQGLLLSCLQTKNLELREIRTDLAPVTLLEAAVAKYPLCHILELATLFAITPHLHWTSIAEATMTHPSLTMKPPHN